MTNPLEQIRELAKNICNHYIVGSHASFKATEILAILDAIAQPVSVPDGWKLVPIQITPEMLHAAFGTADDVNEWRWNAMLSAAPKREGE